MTENQRQQEEAIQKTARLADRYSYVVKLDDNDDKYVCWIREMPQISYVANSPGEALFRAYEMVEKYIRVVEKYGGTLVQPQSILEAMLKDVDVWNPHVSEDLGGCCGGKCGSYGPQGDTCG